MVEKYTEESKAILEANKSLSNQRAEEINRLRAMLDQIEQQKVGSYESYQTLRQEFAKLAVENASLKRLIIALEEMVRATGGDVKLISKKIEDNTENIKEISSILLALPSP